MIDRIEAKNALDVLIKKSRVHLYKPIQIAEILFKARTEDCIDPMDKESYRSKSKRWRDEITLPLLGRVCTSSSKFQDNLFDDNAIPPGVLKVLIDENNSRKGAVEAYIYKEFIHKHDQLSEALLYCMEANPATFDIRTFIDSFWHEPGLKRSLDKVYEIIVFSLFATLVDVLNIKVEVSVDALNYNVLKEFEDFSKKVMCIDCSSTSCMQDGKVYRVGVTNAADRGLDMYANWGSAIQIKHLSLDIELAKDIVNGVSSDRVVIVCKDVEKDIIVSLLTQIGWKRHIQSIVTENDLIVWYEKALRGGFSELTAVKLLETLCESIADEFPSVSSLPEILEVRHYETIYDDFWM